MKYFLTYMFCLLTLPLQLLAVAYSTTQCALPVQKVAEVKVVSTRVA
jgi:hypothetical protein